MCLSVDQYRKLEVEIKMSAMMNEWIITECSGCSVTFIDTIPLGNVIVSSTRQRGSGKSVPPPASTERPDCLWEASPPGKLVDSSLPVHQLEAPAEAQPTGAYSITMSVLDIVGEQ